MPFGSQLPRARDVVVTDTPALSKLLGRPIEQRGVFDDTDRLARPGTSLPDDRFPSEPDPANASLCSDMYYSTDAFSWNGLVFWSKVRISNNCYNYASNYRTDTFAQPGRKAGNEHDGLTCETVMAAVEADGWNVGCPTGDDVIVIALVVAPERDFHFYRLTENGIWHHKPGQTKVICTDASGAKITDPETADRGFYTEFCGYYYAPDRYMEVHVLAGDRRRRRHGRGDQKPGSGSGRAVLHLGPAGVFPPFGLAACAGAE